MIESFSRYLAASGFVLLALPFFASAQATLHVHFFMGQWEKEHDYLQEVSVLKAATHSALADLKSKAAAPAAERTAAALDAILASFELKSVDDLFEFALAWERDGQVVSKDIGHKLAAFRFVFTLHSKSAGRIGLSVSKDSRRTRRAGTTCATYSLRPASGLRVRPWAGMRS